MPTTQDMLFRTLADPTRRALFERLCREGEKTVGALTAKAGVSQPVVSKHLGVLKQAGLVRDRHEGRQTHYSAQLGALGPLVDWTREMAGFWESRFDDLENLLEEDGPMTCSKLIRTTHRWLGMTLIVLTIVNFVAFGIGNAIPWLYYLPLAAAVPADAQRPLHVRAALPRNRRPQRGLTR